MVDSEKSKKRLRGNKDNNDESRWERIMRVSRDYATRLGIKQEDMEDNGDSN